MSDLKTCPVCQTNNMISAEKCVSCVYPFDASKSEQSKFIGQLILKKSTISEASTKIKRARIALWVIGGYFILSSIISILMVNNFPIAFILPNILFGILFIGFGFLTFRLPVISIIIPSVLLLAYWVLMAVLDTNAIIRGILFKIVIIMTMGYALVSAIQSQKLKKESDFLSKL